MHSRILDKSPTLIWKGENFDVVHKKRDQNGCCNTSKMELKILSTVQHWMVCNLGEFFLSTPLPSLELQIHVFYLYWELSNSCGTLVCTLFHFGVVYFQCTQFISTLSYYIGSYYIYITIIYILSNVSLNFRPPFIHLPFVSKIWTAFLNYTHKRKTTPGLYV